MKIMIVSEECRLKSEECRLKSEECRLKHELTSEGFYMK